MGWTSLPRAVLLINNHDLSFKVIQRREPAWMKKKDSQIALAGAINGVKFRFGVANPYTARTPAVLGPAHVKALHALLTFIDPARLHQNFEIDEAALIRRFPQKDILPCLKQLLGCWVQTSSGDAVSKFSNFAEVSFYEDPKNKIIFVGINPAIVPVLKGMLDHQP